MNTDSASSDIYPLPLSHPAAKARYNQSFLARHKPKKAITLHAARLSFRAVCFSMMRAGVFLRPGNDEENDIYV
ncbi:MAG: hypothetical protein QNK37_30875 [Acidobacteriota bacterium]|nr:hypothetical protein [Acidobacteriota bacterium]